MNQPPKFQEEYSAKIPALALLSQLGWTLLPPEQALAARGGKTHEVVLRDVLRNELRKRRFSFAGQEYPLSERAIDKLVHEVCTPALGEGLISANEKLYHQLLFGITVTEFVDGKKASATIPLIDWHDLANNSFLFTEEFRVQRAGLDDHRVPDIVCFVNGMPLVVIEAKRPEGKPGKGPSVAEGISQQLRNQRPDEIPQLFAYSQLLLSISGQDGRYGTTETKAKFWAAWREEDIPEAELQRLKDLPLSAAQLAALFDHRPPALRAWYDALLAQGRLMPTDQDRLLASLLTPARLLEMIRFYTLFDRKAGKIVARYQQVFGIKRLIERVSLRGRDGAREGGVIWHTTGSGKSFTMVFLAKAMILHPLLKNCRIVVVTDRVDLEDQLSRTFASGGALSTKRDLLDAKATSGRRLARQIGQGSERIVFSIINKFKTAVEQPECHNPSADIIVLVDEGHRSQSGENHIRMRQALPKAAFVAFTGTPLLKDDKTRNKFGPILHAYTMQRAVEDKTVTPLLYEERIPDLDVNERAIDAWFERITDRLTEAQKTDLKRKFAKKGQVYTAEDRVRLIAYDIANHFTKNIDEGLKGQLACDSKRSAIQYKRFLDETGLLESAVVISAPDTREGNDEVDESKAPEVARWWKENVGSVDEEVYTKAVIERFENDDDLKLLIVVDKLLTGFDEPRNTVLYIDKPLKEHNIIQAIARVNRLHPQKRFGLLIDDRGILKELDTAIAEYQDLASRTQAGYDIDDLAGLYHSMDTEYKRLPGLYDALWAIFAGVQNTADIEQMRQVLIPKLQEVDGELVDTNQKIRDDFYERLTAFAACLKIALQSAAFFEDRSFTEADRRRYKEALKQFSSLRQLAQQDAGETVDYDEYAVQVKKLMDKHVVGVEVREPKGVYDVGRMGKQADPAGWSEDKTRNETDLIKTRLTRMIEQDMRDDPYAREVFSKLLRQAIAEAEALFDHPLKQYLLFREFEEKVEARQLDELPAVFRDQPHAQGWFGIFKLALPEALAAAEGEAIQPWIELAFTVEQAVTDAVAEQSLNPQNVENSIRQRLLPLLFQQCRQAGFGMDQARAMLERIVQTTRVGHHAAAGSA